MTTLKKVEARLRREMTTQARQMSIFDIPVRPYANRVPSAPSAPSKAAAAVIEKSLGKWQRRVLQALNEYGPLSDEALDRVLGCEATRTARPRRRELTMAGYIEDSNDRVMGVGGVMVTLWQNTQLGQETAEVLRGQP